MFYCDRCNAQITDRLHRTLLSVQPIHTPDDDPLHFDLCFSCHKELVKFLDLIGTKTALQASTKRAKDS